jgi:polyisoprenoid-binding protein YceI
MSPARTFYITLCATLILLALPLAGTAQELDYNRSQINFVSRQLKVPVEAKFNRFTAQLSFDPANPQASKARIEVDLASFDIGNDEVNTEIQGRHWFDSRNFPKATFVSSSVHALGDGRYAARGPLTIKGRTHEVMAPFTVKTDGSGNSVFDGAFDIRRLQYNVGEGLWKDTELVADEVRIRFRFYTASEPGPKK